MAIKHPAARRLRLFSALALVFCLFINMLPVPANAVTQSEIDELKKQKQALQAERDEKQAVVDELESQHAEMDQQKQAMYERNSLILQEMEVNRQQIGLYDQMIEDKSKELDEALQRENDQLERYRERVRAMEENGEYDFLVMVLQSQNLAELLTNIDDVGEIMEYDRQIEDDYIAAREEAEAAKEEYESFKAEIEAAQDELRAEQVELDAQISETLEDMFALETEIESRSELIDQLDETLEAAQKEIDEKVAELQRQKEAEEAARRAEEAKRAAAAAAASGGSSSSSGGSSSGGSVTGTGSFSWPVPGRTYITSRFGPRVHPITGKYQSTHKGLDIAADYGESIYAADSGTVYYSGYNAGGYGNYVMIDHGNGYMTLYGHMTSTAVSTGDTVSKGSVIGYVGSTGMSNGPHCHFEIRINGSVTDPSAYFSGLTFAD